MKRGLWALVLVGMALPGSIRPAEAQNRIATRLGEAVLNGERVFVHVTVAVPRGANANAATEDALRGQGARPFQSAQFKTTGLDWDAFSSFKTAGDKVTQNYNSSGEKVVAETALANTHATWNAVAKSRFRFSTTIPTTTRCPSLVKECPGPQVFDSQSDVGWLALGGCCTLGVTWYSTGRPEADMALNSNFNWDTAGTNQSGVYDVETVLLHENGHVLGLDHSTVSGAVMEATYAGVRQDLHIDDERGDIYLYPTTNATGSIGGRITVKDTGTALASAVVTIADMPGSTTTDPSGNYSLSGIPDLGTYTVKASASGYKAGTRETVSVGSTSADVELEPGTTRGGRPR